MPTKRFVAIAAAAFLLPVAASAGEIVHFTNGSQMVVEGHAVEAAKGMIRLDLGGGSSVSFPTSMVEKIEASGRSVYMGPASNSTNRAAAGSGSTAGGPSGGDSGGAAWGSYATPNRTRSASERRRQMLDPEQQMALAAEGAPRDPGTPAPGLPGARIRALGVPRDRTLGDPLGASPVGDDRYQISPTAPQRRTFPSFGPRTGGAAQPTNPNESQTSPPAGTGQDQGGAGEDPAAGNDAGSGGGSQS